MNNGKVQAVKAIVKEGYTCSLCLDTYTVKDGFCMPETCTHSFCQQCFTKFMASSSVRFPPCPQCREPIHNYGIVPKRVVKKDDPTLLVLRSEIEKKSSAVDKLEARLIKSRAQISKLEALIAVNGQTLITEKAALANLKSAVALLEKAPTRPIVN